MDFHFVPDPKQNLEHILNCWEQRKRTYKEKWLGNEKYTPKVHKKMYVYFERIRK